MDIDPEIRNYIITILKNPKESTPTDTELIEAVSGGVDSLTAKWRLRFLGYTELNIELALQRAVDRSVLRTNLNWHLEVV